MASYKRQNSKDLDDDPSPRPGERVSFTKPSQPKKFSFMGVASSASDQATLLDSYPRKEKPTSFVMKSASMASLNSILLGYDIGVMGGAMVLIVESFDLSDFQYELGLSILNIMAIFGAALSN